MSDLSAPRELDSGAGGGQEVKQGQGQGEKQEGEKQGEGVMSALLASDALVMQPSVSGRVRAFLSLAILFNISLFLWSNVINIATVIAVLDVRDKEDDLGEVFVFNLKDSVKDMWTAEAYALSVLLAFFSGAWPYIKLASMFLAFVLPKSLMSFKLRDGILVWLDILGKWSLLDTFFMVMMMVAFQFDLFVARDVEINVYVRAEWGFYAFLLATVMSLILGHIVLYIHRSVTDVEKGSPSASVVYGGNSLEGEAVMNHTFFACMKLTTSSSSSSSSSANSNKEPLVSNSNITAAGDWKTRKISMTLFAKIFIVLLLISCILAIIFGTFRNTFNFEFKGLTGLLMGDESIQTYSAVSIGTELPAASRIPGDTGIRGLQAAYFIFLVAMPLAFLTCTLGLWLVPLTLYRAKYALLITEVLNAWSALDVFVVALVACLLEIQLFAAFIVGKYCISISTIRLLL
jgi:hypothetical protein